MYGGEWLKNLFEFLPPNEEPYRMIFTWSITLSKRETYIRSMNTQRVTLLERFNSKIKLNIDISLNYV